MGGRMVLLYCEDKEELKDLVELAADWLGQWFKVVRPWTPEMVAKERATGKCPEKEKEVIEPVSQVGIVDGTQMGFKNKPRRSSFKEPNAQEASLEYQESTNMGLTQDRREKKSADPTYNKDCFGIREMSEDEIEEDGEDGYGEATKKIKDGSIKKQLQSQLAKEIWDLAKQLGANAENEVDVLGMGGIGKKRQIREIMMKEKVDFIAIQETKLVTVDRKICRIIWGTDDFDWVAKPSVGRSGGLLCIWNAKVLKKMEWELRRSVSDHCPILLKNEKIDWGPKPFKFFDAWFEKPGCMELITGVWKSSEVQGQKSFILKEKLKRKKKALKEWSWNLDEDVDDKEIKEEVAKYFKDFFSEEAWQRPKLDGIRVNQISQADNELLVADFEEKEIKEAIWDCCSSKSPGSDGFNFGFVKKMWEDIKVEVIDFVQEFWEHGRLARGSNASFIVLIPKKENPQGIEDCRPISLIGIIQLADGVVIANEVIDEAKRKRKKSFLFKADFEKAYDRVCWSFIEYMMMRMGFSKKWRKWIQECLRSSSVSVLINGSPTKEFSASKGIRQRDPLSLFLFLIVAERLNGSVSAAVEKNLYKGVMVGNGDTMITHLQFADDTIFFGEAFDENIKVVKGIMRTFELASGLKINFAKSQLMGMGVEESWTTRMAYRLCCTQGEFLLKYLGIPIGGNHRKIAMWYPMVQSFKKKLASWKGRHLSLGGHITLINSVLSSLPVFLINGTWTWNLNWRRNLYEWEVDDAVELQKRIENVKIVEGDLDSWEWSHDKGGQYSTKTVYSLLTWEQVELKEEKTYKRIWNPILPSKISAFNWQLVLDKIPTKANLIRRGIIKDVTETKCALCNEEEENATHLFLKCKIARWVWKACSKWWGSKMMVNRDCWNTFQLLGMNTKGSKTREGMDSSWKTTVWSI
ncbi:hypothetical protein SLEP1_g55143 [Rubroshorea leprosula]|uniref:Reverse transcriptase domain-containing protein n=1 Tax=Rubroshorea leprosula TaxID=152421 RepID=A0AAV5MFC7_9ROSI|nr:hypothetical protein SLEP1_g55143 [Rubroshorea leprosula]